MASKEQTYDYTVINYGEKLVAIPFKDIELNKYIAETEKLKSSKG